MSILSQLWFPCEITIISPNVLKVETKITEEQHPKNRELNKMASVKLTQGAVPHVAGEPVLFADNVSKANYSPPRSLSWVWYCDENLCLVHMKLQCHGVLIPASFTIWRQSIIKLPRLALNMGASSLSFLNI